MFLKNSLKSASFTFAYQPIVNAAEGTIIAYEALVRGLNNEPAYKILDPLKDGALYKFDEESRIAAINLANTLSLQSSLNLNFHPRSLNVSESSIQSTLEAATLNAIDLHRIILEITEHEIIADAQQFSSIISEFKGTGIKFAIDDFGAGYSGLNLLSEFQPDFIKIDMQLVRDIPSKGPRQAIARGIIRTCLDLGIDIIAEGIETVEEFWWFRSEGVELFQGYLFAKPAFQKLPLAYYPC